VISDSKQSFFAWLFYDSAALLTYCPNQCDRPEIYRWDSLQYCSHDPVQQGFGVSVLRDSQGSEASSTAAATDSRLLFLAEFLESGIAAQRIP
jgi:hypothetical protein